MLVKEKFGIFLARVPIFLSIIASVVTIVSLPLILIQINQTEKSIELSSTPSVSVDALLDNNVLKLNIRNDSLTEIDNLLIKGDVFTFPPSFQQTCLTIELGVFSAIDKLPPKTSTTTLLDLNRQLSALEKIRSEAYKGNMANALRLNFYYSRSLDGQSFSKQKVYSFFNKSTLISFGQELFFYLFNPKTVGFSENEFVQRLLNTNFSTPDSYCPIYNVEAKAYFLGSLPN